MSDVLKVMLATNQVLVGLGDFVHPGSIAGMSEALLTSTGPRLWHLLSGNTCH